MHGSVHRPESGAELDAAVHSAVQSATATPGRVATVILPADYSWGIAPQNPLPDKGVESSGTDDVDLDVTGAAELLRAQGERAVLLLGGSATGIDGLRAAARIRTATGARALVETFPARLARGKGYPPSNVSATWPNRRRNNFPGQRIWCWPVPRRRCRSSPIRGKPSVLVPDGAQVRSLAVDELCALADELGGNCRTRLSPPLPSCRPRHPQPTEPGAGDRRAIAGERHHLR